MDRISTRLIWRLAFPLALAGLGETLIDIIDVAFLAHYGVVEAGAVGLADAIYETILVVVLGLAEGLQVMFARRVGEGSQNGLAVAFRMGLRMLLCACVLVFVVVRFLVPQVLGALVESAAVEEAAGQFLEVIVLGVGFEAVNLLLAAFYLALGRVRVLVAATVLMAVTNIVLDYALVFGNLGLPEMGIAGAAWASVAAELASMLALLGFALARGDLRAHGLVAGPSWDRRTAVRLAAIAAPSTLEFLVGSARWFCFFLIVEHMGETALAGANLVYACFTLLIIPIGGLAEATCTLTSRLIGRGQGARIRVLLRRATLVGWTISAPLMALAVLVPELVLAMFTDEAELVLVGIGALQVVGVSMLFVTPGELAQASVVGTGDTTASCIIEVIVAMGALLHAWLAGVVFGQPLAVVWLFLPAGMLLRAVLSRAWLRSEVWRRVAV